MEYTSFKLHEPLDFAILDFSGCGHPLTHYIVTHMQKPAVYIGGGTQLLFGLTRERWETHDGLARLIKPSWVMPLLSERPVLPGNVEDSVYWSNNGDVESAVHRLSAKFTS